MIRMRAGLRIRVRGCPPPAPARQYRRALPLDKAMEAVAALAGESFDPKVVEVLQRRYAGLERKATAQASTRGRASTDLKIENRQAPASRFESGTTSPRPPGGTATGLFVPLAA